MIVFHIDVMLAKRKMSLTELSERVGITLANLSILKTGKARAVRMETLDRLCAALDCQYGGCGTDHAFRSPKPSGAESRSRTDRSIGTLHRFTDEKSDPGRRTDPALKSAVQNVGIPGNIKQNRHPALPLGGIGQDACSAMMKKNGGEWLS